MRVRKLHMGKLDLISGKKLVLKKVIIKKLHGIALQDLDHEIQKFYQQLKLLNVQMFGPLITRNKGTNIHEDGTISVDYELYTQAHDYQQYAQQFDIRDEIRVENCLYVRFCDSPEYLELAHAKMNVYIYEEDVPVLEDTYTVFVSSNDTQMTVDIFKPVGSL